MTLGYRSPAEMLEDLTEEEFAGWWQYYQEDPWDEARQDRRSAVNTLWHLAPYLKQEDFPNLEYPYFEPEETPEELEGRIEIITEAAEALKAKWQQASQNSPSS